MIIPTLPYDTENSSISNLTTIFSYTLLICITAGTCCMFCYTTSKMGQQKMAWTKQTKYFKRMIKIMYRISKI